MLNLEYVKRRFPKPFNKDQMQACIEDAIVCIEEATNRCFCKLGDIAKVVGGRVAIRAYQTLYVDPSIRSETIGEVTFSYNRALDVNNAIYLTDEDQKQLGLYVEGIAVLSSRNDIKEEEKCKCKTKLHKTIDKRIKKAKIKPEQLSPGELSKDVKISIASDEKHKLSINSEEGFYETYDPDSRKTTDS